MEYERGCCRWDGAPCTIRTSDVYPVRGAAAALLLSSSAADAHHSFAMFDPAKDVTVEAVVKVHQSACVAADPGRRRQGRCTRSRTAVRVAASSG